MKRRLAIFLVLLLMFSADVFAQNNEPEFEMVKKGQGWKKFNKKIWDNFDFTKKKVTKAQIGKLNSDGAVDELALLRGVVFGKRGRIFKERSIQDYLEKQPWYKPK